MDVEDDPPCKPVDYKKFDYFHKRPSTKIKSKIAYFVGLRWVYSMIRKKIFVRGGVNGLENIKGFKGGAIITCNHCHMFDNFVVLLELRKHFRDMGNRLYRVVREGNLSQPGWLGFFFRHCDTLPVHERNGNNLRLTAKTMSVIGELVAKGKKVLIYPEQGMWWNYRKPRPMKNGAFLAAAKSMAPIIPCFVTMRDTDKIGGDGFPIQEFTLNIAPVIYPDANLTAKDNAEIMKQKNFDAWKEIYESVYGEELKYGD